VQSKKTDVLIVTVPYTIGCSKPGISRAPAAPAILMSVLKNAGYSTHFYDLNAELNFNSSKEQFSLIEEFATTDIFRFDIISYDVLSKIEFVDIILKTHIEKILDYNPKYIGISVFTYECLNWTKALCVYIREFAPDIKIILGGQGLNTHYLGDDENPAGKKIKEHGLCDYCVYKEGEDTIIDVLKNNHHVGEPEKQLKDLDRFPFPDYGDYKWKYYPKVVPIVGSRGCVRRCTFCNVPSLWREFVWRSGEQIVKEMVYQYEQTGISKFEFKDSLVNGSMKSYYDFITALADYNKNSEVKLKWSGQFIFRPQRQHPTDFWELTSKSADILYVGVESLSETIRNHMRKKFSNDDIRYSLAEMKKHNIRCKFFMIVGYITETEETIQETFDMYKELSHYANNTIESISWPGVTLGIQPDTPLAEIAKEEGVQFNFNMLDWSGPSTYEQRIEWKNRTIEYCKSLGYSVKFEKERSKKRYSDIKNVRPISWTKSA